MTPAHTAAFVLMAIVTGVFMTTAAFIELFLRRRAA